MDLQENVPSQLQNPGPAVKNVLVSLYLDGTEKCKKVFSVSSALALLQACHSEFSHPVELHRLLHYNSDFKDYIDCDSSIDFKDYDRFQVWVSTMVHLDWVECVAPHTESENVSILRDVI